MTLVLYYLKGKSEAWAEEACAEYVKKISNYFSVERVALKSKSSDREQKEDKIKAEAEAILKALKSNDLLILFDEKGKTFKSSKDFSEEFLRQMSMKKSRMVFVIGGPYGFSDEVRSRAQAKWSLSGLTFNHHVAQVAALEQIYRALTIWKGVPYHNE
jgi:23S rRNA (pseudouridine1915-N3)-methyltransferase